MRKSCGCATKPGKVATAKHIVLSLAESFGGHIWVEDRVSGSYTKGARLIVMLPAIIE